MLAVLCLISCLQMAAYCTLAAPQFWGGHTGLLDLQVMTQDKALQRSTQMWAAVQGGRHLDIRADHAAATAQREGISGFVIGGLQTGQQSVLGPSIPCMGANEP